MGWQADINDGVRLNIRPFLSVDAEPGQEVAAVCSAPSRAAA
jgi:hypothetical protein